jgi:hypothetical protein
MDILITEFQKNAVENVRFALHNYKSRCVINIRTY